MLAILRPVTILILFLVLPRCATLGVRYSVDIDAISSSLGEGKRSYILIPGNADTSLFDLQFQEYAEFAVRALSANGYFLADTVEDAELVIGLSYAIGDPVTSTNTSTIPLYGQTGTSSSTTTGTARTIGNTTRINATTTNIPTYGITGIVPITTSKTEYLRVVQLIAFDNQVPEQAIELWRTSIVSTGSSGDLRQVFPIMIGAATMYLGENSKQRQRVTLSACDEKVILITQTPC